MPVTGSPWDHKHEITIVIDEAGLSRVTDECLAVWWHVAQANPADGFASGKPGDLAEKIGREIVRRWLAGVRPELWHHQGRHYYWYELYKLGSWNSEGVFVPDAPADPEATAAGGSGGPASQQAAS
jgi:hypothetical protein